ncbi:MAG: Gmad2 immunoglobulin-like domain-containing protein [Anaerolineae bacterium]|jgi:hypothetical protein
MSEDMENQDLVEEEAAAMEDEAATGAPPPRKSQPWWVIGIAVAAVILLAITLCACVWAAVALFTVNEVQTSPMPPVVVTVPAAESYLIIDEPVDGAVLQVGQPFGVAGRGAGLIEGNVVVQIVTADGDVLAQQPTTLQGPDVATGGQGTWFVEMSVQAEPGTPAQILAISRSPLDNSVVASTDIMVTLGETQAIQPFVRIEQPAQGAVLEPGQPFTVSGRGAGLFEGNVVVEVADAQGSILVQQPTTAQGPDVGVGGEGTWSLDLTVEIEPGSPAWIRAFSTSPKDGSTVAEHEIEVSFGGTPSPQAYLRIEQPAGGATIDATQPVAVSGSGAGLLEGNVVVLGLDQAGNVVDEETTTLQGPDVGTGGEGAWQVELDLEGIPSASGHIVAFSPSPADDSVVAADRVPVAFGEAPEGGTELEGVNWYLTETTTGQITARFQDGRVSGSAGCNNYFGSYILTPGSDALEIGELATTRMMCEEAVMEQESAFLQALSATTAYSVDDDLLTLTYPDGTLLFSGQ